MVDRGDYGHALPGQLGAERPGQLQPRGRRGSRGGTGDGDRAVVLGREAPADEQEGRPVLDQPQVGRVAGVEHGGEQGPVSRERSDQPGVPLQQLGGDARPERGALGRVEPFQPVEVTADDAQCAAGVLDQVGGVRPGLLGPGDEGEDGGLLVDVH